MHTVRADETYEDLSVRYYGKKNLARQLMLYNLRPEPLAPGSQVLVPTTRAFSPRRGESLEDFARRYLGDPRRADYLAEVNRLEGSRQHLSGTRPLAVPLSLRHRVRARESLRSLARFYYADDSPGRLRRIAFYNALKGTEIKPGQTIRIPLDLPPFDHAHVRARLRASTNVKRRETPLAGSGSGAAARPGRSNQVVGVDAPRAGREPVSSSGNRAPSVARRPRSEAREPATSEPSPPLSPAEAFAKLEALYIEGWYRAVVEGGQSWLADPAFGEDPRWRCEILQIVGASSVALGDLDGARAAFRKLLELDSAFELDLYRTSPKVLSVFHEVAVR